MRLFGRRLHRHQSRAPRQRFYNQSERFTHIMTHFLNEVKTKVTFVDESELRTYESEFRVRK